MARKINTVTGEIKPDELGFCLSHEHILASFPFWVTPRDEATKREIELNLENRGRISKDPGISEEYFKLHDEDLMIQEVLEFKKAGGNSICEMSLPGAGRDPVGLQRISRVVGVNIICSTGFYIESSHPDIVKKMDIDQICDFSVAELEERVKYPIDYLHPLRTELPPEQNIYYQRDTGIKANILKAAMGYPISKEEEKVIKAVSLAQSKTGAPLTIHPGQEETEKKRKVYKLEEPLNIIENTGADLKKCYVSHSNSFCANDRHEVDINYLVEILESYPVTLNFDSLGTDFSFDSLWPGAIFMSDDVRILAIVKLCERGYADRIMLSHDVWTKLQLKKYGGHGYSHIIENVIPRLEYLGIRREEIEKMIKENQKEVLAW